MWRRPGVDRWYSRERAGGCDYVNISAPSEDAVRSDWSSPINADAYEEATQAALRTSGPYVEIRTARRETPKMWLYCFSMWVVGGVVWELKVDGSAGEQDGGQGGLGTVEAVGTADDEPCLAYSVLPGAHWTGHGR